MLLKFAESADEVQKTCSMDGMSLVEAMQQKRVDTAEELASRLEDQLSAGVTSVAADVCVLARLCKKLPSDAPQQGRATAVAEKFVQSASESTAAAEEALGSMDGLEQALQDLGCKTTGFREDLVTQVRR